MCKMIGNSLLIAVCLACLAVPCARGQSDPANPKVKKIIGHAAVGFGGLSTNVKGGGNATFTAGVDWGLGNRVGVQLDGGGLVAGAYSLAGYGLLSPSVSFHPANWKDPRTDFFIFGGYTFLGNSYRYYNLVCFGGGLNYWRSEISRVGVRVEFRDHIGEAAKFTYTATGAIHIWQIRIGVAIRGK